MPTQNYLHAKVLRLVRFSSFILRNIKRLAKAGLITEERGQAGKAIKFKVTDRFKLGDYIVGSPHCPTEPINTASTEDSSANLNEQLSHHKLELLTTIGEVEEYEKFKPTKILICARQSKDCITMLAIAAPNF